MQATRQPGSAAMAFRAASRRAVRSASFFSCGDDRHRRRLCRGRRAGRGRESHGAYPAPCERGQAGAALPRAALGEGDLGRRRQRERDLAGRRISIAGVHFETAQHDLLQPLRRRRHQRARRNRIAVEAPPELGHSRGVTERQAPRRELVQDAAQGEDVRSRVAAHAEHLLGRHVHPVAERNAQLFGKEIGKVPVVGEPEVDQDSFAVRPEQHVGGLQVEVNDVLPMQVGERKRHRGAEARDHLGRHRRALGPVVQPDAVDVLHDEVRRGFDVSVRDERRVMTALRNGSQHRAADLEADDVDRPLAGSEARDLHDERKGAVVTGQAENRRHAPGMDHLAQAEPVDRAARFRQVRHDPRSSRSARRSGSPAARFFRMAAPWSYGTRKNVRRSRSLSKRA